MSSKKTKQYYFQKLILAGFLLFALVFSCPQKAEAALWPGVDPAIELGLTAVYDTIQGIIMGAMKQAAIVMLNRQIDSLAGSGSGGEPAFITNWENYLIRDTKNRTKLYMNDYLSQMTRGRNSRSGYSAEGFSGSNGYVARMAKNSEAQLEEKIPEPTYEGDPSRMFESGNFKNMEHYLSGTNNPWAFQASVEAEQQKKLEEEKFIAQSQAIAYQGFKGAPAGEDSKSVSSPGILTKEIIASTQRMPGEAITSAKSMQEVIVAVVGQVVSKSIQQGFSSVQRKIQKATDIKVRLDANIDGVMSGSGGPGVRFEY